MGILLKNGKWVLRKHLPDYSEIKRIAPSKRAAQELLARINEAIWHGTWQELKHALAGGQEPASLASVWAKFLDHAPQALRPASVRAYKAAWGHLRPVFGTVAAGRITRASVRGYIERRLVEGASRATINREIAVLKGLLSYALDTLGSIEIHPLARFRVLKLDEKEKRIPSADEIECFAKAVRHRDPILAAMILFLAETGLRRSEAWRLKRQSISRQDGCVSVDGQSKSHRVRHVPLSSTAIALLDALVPHVNFSEVFIHPSGRPYTPERIRHTWEAARRDTGLEWFGLHSLRHYAITNWVRGGNNLRDIQEWAGHSNILTTMGYAHATPAFGAALRPKQSV